MTSQERLANHQIALILDATDNSFNGLPLMEAWQVLQKGMTFSAFVCAVNRLISLKLIRVDGNYVAYRVKL